MVAVGHALSKKKSNLHSTYLQRKKQPILDLLTEYKAQFLGIQSEMVPYSPDVAELFFFEKT